MTEKIKVLYIGPFLPQISGTEVFTMNYCNNLDPSKFTFDFLKNSEGEAYFSNEIRNSGKILYNLGSFRKHPVVFIERLQRILTENNYDIVHINVSNLGDATAILTILFPFWARNKPVIIAHSHCSSMMITGLRSTARLGLHKCASFVIRRFPIQKWACSVTAGTWIWGNTFNGENVIPNAIDASHYRFSQVARARVRSSCGFSEENLVIGFVGRLAKAKNVLFLAEILHELKIFSPQYRLLVIGTGDMESPLRNELKKYNLENDTQFTGACDNTAPWYSAMDAFVLPSLYEGLGIAGLEAQACGVPCFVSEYVPPELNVMGMIQYLPIDKGGKIWAEAIHSYIQNYKETQRMNVAFPPEYDIHYAAKQMEKRYLSLVKKYDKSEE